MLQIIKLKIDVTKLDKTSFYHSEKGPIYADATLFFDPENPGKYGDHGMITQDISKERRDKGDKGAVLGNGKLFRTLPSKNAPQAQAQPTGDSYAMWQEYQKKQAQQGQVPAGRVLSKDDANDEIPF